MSIFKALDNITKYVKIYRELDPNDGNGMMECLQQISATLFYLEKERAEYHDKFQKRISELVLSGESVSRAENTAHSEIPEMYLLRRVMDAAYVVCESIRSQTSWIKTGLRNG